MPMCAISNEAQHCYGAARGIALCHITALKVTNCTQYDASEDTYCAQSSPGGHKEYPIGPKRTQTVPNPTWGHTRRRDITYGHDTSQRLCPLPTHASQRLKNSSTIPCKITKTTNENMMNDQISQTHGVNPCLWVSAMRRNTATGRGIALCHVTALKVTKGTPNYASEDTYCAQFSPRGHKKYPVGPKRTQTVPNLNLTWGHTHAWHRQSWSYITAPLPCARFARPIKLEFEYTVQSHENSQ